MNKPVILLSVVCVGLLAGMVLQSRRAADRIEFAGSESATLSNRLSEAEIKLHHQERVAAAQKSQLEERAAELARLTNEVAQLNASLAELRSERLKAAALSDSLSAQARALTGERAALVTKLNESDLARLELERQLRGVRELLLAGQSERASLSWQLTASELERRRLELLLNAPDLLELHHAHALRQQDASKPANSPGKADYRLPLQLQPDGSVRLLPVAAATKP